MLKELNIKNFAIIDDLQLTFNEGFSVLTGETGAGKSIIIDALGILIGDRSSATLVRSGANKAFIEGVFVVSDQFIESIKDLVDDFNDNFLYVSRDIYSDGKTISKINGRNTTISVVKEICNRIIDIHSQHDNQYLLNPHFYIDLLDRYGDNELKELKAEYQKAYNAYYEVKKKIEELSNIQYSSEDIEYLQYQINEIEELALKIGEIESLEAEEKRFSKHEHIAESVSMTIEYLSRESGAIDSLYLARRALEKIADDELFTKHYEQLEGLYYSTADVLENLKSDFENLDFDQNRLLMIKERIFNINKIRRKHGKSYEDIQVVLQEMKEKVETYQNHGQMLNDLSLVYDKHLAHTQQIGLKLSSKRFAVAEGLQKQVMQELKDLFLENAIFEITFSKLENLSINGIDRIEFLVTMNPGQPLKPLSKVASGGEISRLMLGLKVIFNRLQGISVVVFDEIDTGVSGKVARAVGYKMRNFAKFSQVLCITHLAQVASLGDFHYHVDKIIKDNTTSTTVTLLSYQQRVNAIAKLISGNDITSATISAALELINQK